MLILAVVASCATPELWQRTDPTEYVRVSTEDITEEELIAKGLTYLSSEDGEFFYVGKSLIEKLGDYTLRLLGTPIAVALDAAMILVVGTVSMTIDDAIHKARQKCMMDPDCHL